MDFKEILDTFKQSGFGMTCKEYFSPAWESIKKGNTIVFVMSLVLMVLFAPIQSLIKAVFSLFGLRSLFYDFSSFSSFKYFMEGIFEGSSNPFDYLDKKAIIFAVVAIIIMIVIYIIQILVTVFFVPAATIKSSSSFAETNEKVSIGEYFKNGFTAMFPLGFQYILNVIIPVIIVAIVCWVIDFIPYINGSWIGVVAQKFAYYAFLYRFIAKCMQRDINQSMSTGFKYWASYSIIAYIITGCITLTIVDQALKILFIIAASLQISGRSGYLINEAVVETASEDNVSIKDKLIK